MVQKTKIRFSRPDRDIVINSLINNTWGPEQRCANVFAVGQPFSIRILVLKDYIKVCIELLASLKQSMFSIDVFAFFRNALGPCITYLLNCLISC